MHCNRSVSLRQMWVCYHARQMDCVSVTDCPILVSPAQGAAQKTMVYLSSLQIHC